MPTLNAPKKDNRIIFVCPKTLRARLDQFLIENPSSLLSGVLRVALDEFLTRRDK
jgi:hypothetical protein